MRIKILALTMLAALALPLAACGQQSDWDDGQVAYQQQRFFCHTREVGWLQDQPCGIPQSTISEWWYLNTMTASNPYYGYWRANPTYGLVKWVEPRRFTPRSRFNLQAERARFMARAQAAKPAVNYGSATDAKPLTQTGTTTMKVGKVTTNQGTQILSSQPRNPFVYKPVVRSGSGTTVTTRMSVNSGSNYRANTGAGSSIRTGGTTFRSTSTGSRR